MNLCNTITDDFTRFNAVQQKLLNPPGSVLKNVPLKIYLPSSEEKNENTEAENHDSKASLRVIQALIPTRISPSMYHTSDSDRRADNHEMNSRLLVQHYMH